MSSSSPGQTSFFSDEETGILKSPRFTAAELDEAIRRRPEMEGFLRQEMHEGVELGASAALLTAFAGNQS